MSRVMSSLSCYSPFFFFNDTATTEIYTLSLHDALPICPCFLMGATLEFDFPADAFISDSATVQIDPPEGDRSEEHTSELQSRLHLVCRLLLEKKKKTPLHTPSSSMSHSQQASSRASSAR